MFRICVALLRVPIHQSSPADRIQILSTRREKGPVPRFVADYVSWGAGPRATQSLVLGGKARAILHGRYYVDIEDIRAIAPAVLRHEANPVLRKLWVLFFAGPFSQVVVG